MSNAHDSFEPVPPRDELDALLRLWHEENVERARSGRAMLMARLGNAEASGDEMNRLPSRASVAARIVGVARSRVLRAAASLAFFIGALALLIPFTSQPAMARQEVILLPDGGKLEARDARGEVIGPCALRHTDVHAEIAGPFTRVTVKQKYHNPYARKIEAVYTFPLSHRAAVDRMTMTVGDRIIEGEVKERQQARRMYESAREAGHVASLLEQERPNIFTQSVANIEPNAEVLIEISYVEMLQQRDGEYTFDFPMVVAPRYVPGSPVESAHSVLRLGKAQALPNELERREGVILLGPASFVRLKTEMTGAVDQGNLQFNSQSVGPAPWLQRIVDSATAILEPDAAYRAREDVQALYRANPNYDFEVTYADGTREFGQIAGDGLGHIAGRWFYFDPAILAEVQREAEKSNASFARDTNQVPDAGRITPMPVRPPMRAGHDISVTVSINTGEGGPAIIDWKSDLHEIECTDPPSYRDLGNKVNLALKDRNEIPNRDFVLRWRCIDDSVREAVFAHADPKWVDRDDGRGGGFFTAVIAPPARVKPENVLPRELVFVLDTSGSMQGLPIEKAKAVMSKAIDAMRPGDAFNLITFSGDTRILWKTPRSNTEANRAEAQAFLAGQSGNGGTEMMTAINAALSPTVDADVKTQALSCAELANLPADGRLVDVVVDARLVEGHDDPKPSIDSALIPVNDRVSIRARWTTSLRQWLPGQADASGRVTLRGRWSTVDGERVFEVSDVVAANGHRAPEPLRIVMFLTDGQVGNDDAIIAAVRENSKTTRVFSFGIGDSPNRYLLDGIAQAGRGEAAYVNLNNDPDAAVQAFARRIESPVLRDIQIAFSGGLEVFDLLPAADAGGLPDLWDVKPLIVHGRYTSTESRSGKITITGRTATGDYTRVIDVTLPAKEESQSMLPALWARARIDEVLARDDGVRRNGAVQYAGDESKREVVALGERYGITSAFTSFVAIEKTRVTIAGRPMLVPIPIEFPSGMNWEGVFGGDAGHRAADDVTRAMLERIHDLDHEQSVRLITLDMARRDTTATPQANLQAHDNLARELTILEAQKQPDADVNYDGAPSIDLDAALKQSESMYRALSVVEVPAAQAQYGGALAGIGGVNSYFGQTPMQPEIKELGETIHLGLGRYNFVPAVGDTTMTLGWSDMSRGDPTVGGFGGGGEGGGGGRGAAGVSIFGEAGDDPSRLPSESFALHLIDIVTENVNPDGWDVSGGNLASVSFDQGVLNFRTLNESAEAAQTVDRARGFVNMLAAAIPEITTIARVDAPSTQPFDPVKDISSPPNEDRPDEDRPPQRVLYVYDARDLIEEIMRTDECGEGDATQRLMDLITLFVAPDAWNVNGGDRARMQAIKCNLIVTVEQAHHQELERLLTQLRTVFAARGLGGEAAEGPVFRGDGADVPANPEKTAPTSPIVVYDVQDLIQAAMQRPSGPMTRADAMMSVVNAVLAGVDREGWRDAGGDRGELALLANALIVQNSTDSQRRVATLLDGMRHTTSATAPDAGEAQARRDAEMRKALADLQRADRLRRVIDERLWPLTIHAAVDAPGSNSARIVLLVSDARDAAAIERLKALGLRVEDAIVAQNIVAGEVSDTRALIDLALLEFVRRIEPIDQ